MTGPLEDSLRRVCERLGATPATDDPTIVRIMERRTAITRDHLLHPRTDAAPTLTRLRALGVPTGLISDCASDVPAVWHESPLAPLITTPLFSCSEGVKKPDPAIFERACARLGVTPSECLYVGDGGSRELEGATAVGMRAVQLRAGDTDGAGWGGEAIGSLSEALRLL
ncbi:MAG: HAD-IA family hydrolase [Candidatus Rokubacteria bacterium]|nr:HAD-IA family hydrolase [Candidatus Rokubacteria bacterium]